MRWAPDARGRLERAAFELFAERGYSATTVPSITARAGLTTRTFFRYFADKREVIFGGTEIPDYAARLIREAPPALAPVEVIRLALRQIAAERFDGRKEETRVWRRLIAENEELRDRDARKRADLVSATRVAFLERGVGPLDATVSAELGALAFHVALDLWLADATEDRMAQAIDDVLSRVGSAQTARP